MLRMPIPKICLYGEKCQNGEVCLYGEDAYTIEKDYLADVLYNRHDAGTGIHVLISYLVCAWVFLDMFRNYTCPLDVFVISDLNRIQGRSWTKRYDCSATYGTFSGTKDGLNGQLHYEATRI